MAKTNLNPLDGEVALELTQDFMQKFEYLVNSTEALKAADLEKFLSKNFRITTNGKDLAKDLSTYVQSIEKLRQQYSHFEITNLNAYALTSGYQMAVRYTVNASSKSGNKTQIEFLAIAEVEDHKFIAWDEIANLHGAEPLK